MLLGYSFVLFTAIYDTIENANQVFLAQRVTFIRFCRAAWDKHFEWRIKGFENPFTLAILTIGHTKISAGVF